MKTHSIFNYLLNQIQGLPCVCQASRALLLKLFLLFLFYLVIVIVLEEVGCLVGFFLHLFPLCEKSYHFKVSFLVFK